MSKYLCPPQCHSLLRMSCIKDYRTTSVEWQMRFHSSLHTTSVQSPARPPLRPKLPKSPNSTSKSERLYVTIDIIARSQNTNLHRTLLRIRPRNLAPPNPHTQRGLSTTHTRCPSSAWAAARKSPRSRRSRRQKLRLTWCRTCTAGTYFPSLPISCSPAICTLAQSSIPMPTLPHLHSHI